MEMHPFLEARPSEGDSGLSGSLFWGTASMTKYVHRTMRVAHTHIPMLTAQRNLRTSFLVCGTCRLCEEKENTSQYAGLGKHHQVSPTR